MPDSAPHHVLSLTDFFESKRKENREMLATDVYELQYTARGLPQHVLYQIQGIRNAALAAESTTNIKVAEWLLSLVEYKSKDLMKKQTKMGTISNNTAQMLGNYFKHIHAHCKEEIQSKMNKPVLSDDEVGTILFESMMKGYFDSIPIGKKFDERAALAKVDGLLDIEIEKRKKAESFKKDAAGLSLQQILLDKW